MQLRYLGNETALELVQLNGFHADVFVVQYLVFLDIVVLNIDDLN